MKLVKSVMQPLIDWLPAGLHISERWHHDNGTDWTLKTHETSQVVVDRPCLVAFWFELFMYVFGTGNLI